MSEEVKNEKRRGAYMLGDTGYERLANAVLQQACRDLYKCRRALNNARINHLPSAKKLMVQEAQLKADIGNWADMMDLNGEFILRKSIEAADNGVGLKKGTSGRASA